MVWWCLIGPCRVVDLLPNAFSIDLYTNMFHKGGQEHKHITQNNQEVIYMFYIWGLCLSSSAAGY